METTTQTIAVVPETSAVERLVEMALATCVSNETRRIYGIQIKAFLASGQPLNREGVATYVQNRRDAGASTSTIHGTLAALRKLINEAYERKLMTHEEVTQIKTIHGGKNHRTRAGMWLTATQAQQFLALPDRSTYWGKRDACLLSILLGCALRRHEMTHLTWEHYQSREDRMCLVDLMGKGRKKRTVPVPTWAIPDVDAWYTASREPEPAPVTALEKARAAHRTVDNSLITGGLGYDGLYDLVEAYGDRMGIRLAPHDLRRTLAQLLRKNGAPLEQIQQTLGHEHIQTTQIYLGSSLELGRGLASVDRLNLGAV